MIRHRDIKKAKRGEGAIVGSNKVRRQEKSWSDGLSGGKGSETVGNGTFEIEESEAESGERGQWVHLRGNDDPWTAIKGGERIFGQSVNGAMVAYGVAWMSNGLAPDFTVGVGLPLVLPSGDREGVTLGRRVKERSAVKKTVLYRKPQQVRVKLGSLGLAEESGCDAIEKGGKEKLDEESPNRPRLLTGGTRKDAGADGGATEGLVCPSMKPIGPLESRGEEKGGEAGGSQLSWASGGQE